MIFKKKAIEFNLTAKKSEFNSAKISSSKDAVNFIRPIIGNDVLIRESFYILTLNRANNITGYALISMGGIAGTVVDAKIIAKFAIESLSSSIVLIHNHPSGNTRPSGADDQITTKISKAMQLLDILVLDHVILTDESYYSYADEGRI